MIAEKLYFTPVHPLNFGVMKRIAEQEFEPGRVAGHRRLVTLFEDVDGLVKLLVSYPSLSDPGNVDDLPCFQAIVGSRSEIANPEAAVGSLSEIADLCDERCEAKIRGWQSAGGH
ncbi:hypothetical protein KDL29_04125 [bacterium]|nr:hypothetical protein [bacterium]